MQLKPALLDLVTDETIVCRCESLPAARIMQAIGEGDGTLRGIKLQTRAGMGSCQGRMCSHLIARLIAKKTGTPLESISPDTARQPVKPIPLRALVNHSESSATGDPWPRQSSGICGGQSPANTVREGKAIAAISLTRHLLAG